MQFEKMHPFPEYFVNSTRYEPMTKFFSDALVAFNGREVKLIHGKESWGLSSMNTHNKKQNTYASDVFLTHPF